MSEWKTEPNVVDFEAHGLQCAARRGPSGHWCGYVAVPKDHALFGKDYCHNVKVPIGFEERQFRGSPIDLLCLDVDLYKEHGLVEIVVALDVHGGVTYADDHCPGEKDKSAWWFGFDCAHAGDLIPDTYGMFPKLDETYRNIDFVRDELTHLAKQLAEWPAPPEQGD